MVVLTMGITIHYQGQLRDEDAYQVVISLANEFAQGLGWQTTPILEESVVLHRYEGEEEYEYRGPARGLVIQPHENCEPFRLEFDENLFVQDFVKTQFAPIEIHIRIVELLKSLNSYFESLEVEDEGEYFETQDQGILKVNFDRFFEVLEGYLEEPDRYHGPIRLPSGRIVDVVGNDDRTSGQQSADASRKD